MDLNNIVTLDTEENTIKFNIVGYYRISLTFSGFADTDTTEFDPTVDFVAVGFRMVGTDDIFIGTSEWNYISEPIQVNASGIISVTDISNTYELVNLSPSTLILNTPKLQYIRSQSYFSNSLITMTIEYLGR